MIVNAAHAIGDGQATEDNEIRIVTSTDSVGRAVVEIRDTGSGIPEANRARIFDRFFTTTPVGMGTGLGLSICHGIVAAHGGELSLGPATGVGTTFRVVLLPARPEAVLVANRPAASVAPGRRGHILVVDDEPMIVRALRRILTPDHEVVTAGNGREAMERFERGERFDVILSETMMPVMSGIDLYEWLSQNIADQAHKIIFITGEAFTPATQALLARAPNQRSEKPFDAMNLRGLDQNLVR